MIVIVAVGVLIASLFRAQQQQQQQQRPRPPVRQPPRPETFDEPPPSADVPTVLPAPRPVRRVLPPPLPQWRTKERGEKVTVVVEPVLSPAVAGVPPTTPRSMPAASLREWLRNPQSLRAAILVREVLDEPLCRRRRRWVL
jgi:hypothetical protein